MIFVSLVAFYTSAAFAGEQPLYSPAPDWVTAPKPLPADDKLGGLVVLDLQQRLEGATVWSYSDTAVRISTPEELTQNNNVTLPWAPDKGDLIIHRLTIVRDGMEIDALVNGQKFTVLRREEALEQREMTGILSATLAVEGLRVGDVLRLQMSITAKDDALGGRSQLSIPLPAEPVRIGVASYRLSWRKDDKLAWKALPSSPSLAPRRNGDFWEVPIALPIAKQPEMPADAPVRFRRTPVLEASTFSNWADVSRIMAPLYATQGLIADGGQLAAEVEKIRAATDDPMQRAAMALQLTQDKIRYLAVGMDGGNYVPAKPERTWDARYGDCKAKTLLLLSMLHALGIEAEAVLAHAEMGDAVPGRVPSALAFNHVVVKATVAGDTLWLDGTGLGSRRADLGDTPPFGYVLPVRAQGADLLQIVPRAPARPTLDLSLDADESTSIDLPSVIKVELVARGQLASLATLAQSRLNEKERRDLMERVLQNFVGEAQYDALETVFDADAATMTIKARGVFGSGWSRDDNRTERWLSRVPTLVRFTPDRARAAWADIPVQTQAPDRMRYRLRIRLPDGGQGYRMEGDSAFDALIGGIGITRSAVLADGYVTVDETLAASGMELAASDLAEQRERVAAAIGRVPRLIAPENARRRWDLAGAESRSQLDAIKAVFAKKIEEADEENITAFTSDISFRIGIGDYKGAEQSLSRQIALLPTINAYLERSEVRRQLGDVTGAHADADAARKLDPSSSSAVTALAMLSAERGDMEKAIAMLDERIAVGGKERDNLRHSKAQIVGEHGDAVAAIEELDALIAAKPGTPMLLNSRCWIKATRNIAIDTALKDCTSALELSDSTASILDSRALVWMRMDRNEDALRDLDAALQQSPSMGSSRFLRAIVLGRLGRGDAAAADLAASRRLEPAVERDYAKFGLKP
ncbi:MAG: DUF3857 domain-containing protein [Sphingopyxis sp.]|uniref:DUF3857 domain-containing protein n=1 Tax=Sphingopyxis sp. TaxID=1908224 RepID=UPI002ABBD14A|nr:DUF3857 domain-containing protein [Sphingopyxis sp.]MDZ3832590.1 DUF3857 domain-containing protein [Sphingopyxis sp.]